MPSKSIQIPELSEQTQTLLSSTELPIVLVKFKPEQNPILAGVQLGKWNAGWKASTAKLAFGGVLFTIPGHRSILIPMSAIAQVEF